MRGVARTVLGELLGAATMRAPSAETQLRRVRSDLRAAEKSARENMELAAQYRLRATKAEQELAEWKRRFDLLLARAPEPPPKGTEP